MDFPLPKALLDRTTGACAPSFARRRSRALGVVFVDGALWMSNALRTTRVAAWPELTAWSRRAEGGAWKAHRPIGDFPAVLELLKLPERHLVPDGLRAWLQLIESIPVETRQAVAPFPSGHWRLLRLVARQPQARDLFDNPALAFALAHASRFVPRGRRGAFRPGTPAMADLLVRRRREIVGALGFPPHEATVRLLGRVPGGAVSVKSLLALRRALQHDAGTAHTLAHVPALTMPLIDLVSRPRLLAVCGAPFLHRVSEQDEAVARALVAMVEDTVDMTRVLREVGHAASGCVPGNGFRDPAQLRRAHDALVVEMGRVEEAASHGALPDPPLPGNPDIVPLRTASEMVAEGREQKNCVGGYVARVRSGRAYVYRVLRPERATLSLVPGRGGWEIGELKAKANERVSWTARAAVEAWLVGAKEATAGPLFGGPGGGPRRREPKLLPLKLERIWGDDQDGRTRRLYRVLRPQPGHLEIVRRDGRWQVLRLAAEDGAPWPTTEAAVRLWLARLRSSDTVDQLAEATHRARFAGRPAAHEAADRSRTP